jgi:putative solute:sodium symporter small subunit
VRSKPDLATSVSDEQLEQEGPRSADTAPRSPFRSSSARWSWALMAIFTVIYFVVAVLTSKEAADLAATMILGLPLGFILGIGMIIAGLIITGIYLNKVKG